MLKDWHPKKKTLDSLLDLDSAGKERIYDAEFSIRVAYQTPVSVKLPSEAAPTEGIPRTFEDALVLENIDLFRKLDGTDLLGRFHEAIADSTDIQSLCEKLGEALGSGAKAGFALDVLYLEDLESVRVPTYISEALEWLQKKLLLRQQEVLAASSNAQTITAGGE